MYTATKIDVELESFHDGNIEHQLKRFLNKESLILREPADNVEFIVTSLCNVLSISNNQNNIK